MNKGLLLALALIAAAIESTFGVATNYALSLAPEATVSCGHLDELNGAKTYTVQLWFNPTEWTPDAALISSGNDWSLKLGQSGTLIFTLGGYSTDIVSPDLNAGKWAQVTIVCENGSGKILVNGKEVAKPTLSAIPAGESDFTIGGNYNGRIDEVRIWKTALSDQFYYFVNNTINRWNPDFDNLTVYYKFDQIDCPDIVEQKAVWLNNTDNINHHGQIIAGVAKKEAVTDNPSMRYRINGAYTANERFYDRAIEAAQYQLSNDLIILGITSYSDGHLDYTTPNDHATPQGGVKYLETYNGRSGVASFDGSGSLNCGKKVFAQSSESFTFESWICIDEWVEGATIFAKQTSDGKHGIALKLGDKTDRVLVYHIDDHFYGMKSTPADGEWFYLGLYPNSMPQAPRASFVFSVNGESKYGAKAYSSDTEYKIPTGHADADLIIGKEFIGKMDNTSFWESPAPMGAGIVGHMNNGCEMPDLGKVVTADIIFKTQAYYTFDDPLRIGFDSYSQDNWKETMCKAYEGLDGWEVRISVKSHNGWESTVANPEKRKIFAADLARLSEGYDGVELDLEWMYNLQTNMGLLADDIRAALPEGKSFMISQHNVTYQFPKDKMDKVDGFTFQQYGPQNQHSKFSHFTSMVNSFLSYGYPSEKILTSYATTTSKGYINGSATTPIQGVRNGFFEADDFDNALESSVHEISGYKYYYNSPYQVFRRAEYTVQKDCGGIFYWDMGNDVPVAHQYNMAKWASFGLNSNVEPKVNKVDIIRHSGVREITVDAENAAQLIRRGDILEAVGASISIASIAGVIIAQGNNQIDISHLPSGVYVAMATDGNGNTKTIKFAK